MMIDDTYAFYCFLKEKGVISDISKIGNNVPIAFRNSIGDLDKKYKNLTLQEKKIYEEKANYLTSEEIDFVIINIAPFFETDIITKAMESSIFQKEVIDAHFANLHKNQDTNNNIIIGEIGLKYPGYLVNLGNLDTNAAEKYCNYKMIDIRPSQNELMFKVEGDIESKQIEIGKWDITIDFTLKNIGNNNITISNIEIFCNYIEITPAIRPLTIGVRDGLDFTKYKSLKDDEGKYYELLPNKEQKVRIKFSINRFWGVPQNSINRNLRALFSISVDYHTILNQKEIILKRTLPTIFHFEFSSNTNKDGNAIFIHEGNISLFYRKHREHKELIKVLTSISAFLTLVKCKAIVLWESKIVEDAQVRKPLEKNIEEMKFEVALSFPGDRRKYVKEIADELESSLGECKVFYDQYFTAQLARPNLDTVLQRIYHNNSKLIVVFLCENYNEKEWCGLEWRAIRDLIKSRSDHKIMFMRFDNANIDGSFGIDGYVDLKEYTPKKAAGLILERLGGIERLSF